MTTTDEQLISSLLGVMRCLEKPLVKHAMAKNLTAQGKDEIHRLMQGLDTSEKAVLIKSLLSLRNSIESNSSN